MGVKNLQTVALCVAKTFGVCVIGTERMGSMRFGLQVSRSLPRLPRLGHYPTRTSSDAEVWTARSASGFDSRSESATFQADNAATAKAVRWAGRSTRG